MDCNVTITGNVGSPVSFKSGETNGRKWQRAEFRVASTRHATRGRFLGDAGTTWITVQAWGTLADGIGAASTRAIPSGHGRLRTDEWVDTNGEVQSLMMVADAVGATSAVGAPRPS